MQKLQRRLSKLDMTIKRHVHGEDKMYGSVTAKNIADKLIKSDLKVSEKDVLLEEPIKVGALANRASSSVPPLCPCSFFVSTSVCVAPRLMRTFLNLASTTGLGHLPGEGAVAVWR